MKVIVTALMFITGTVLAFPQETDKTKKLTEVFKTCQQETGFDGNFQNLKDGQEPAAYKCYLACILKNDGVMNPNGDLSLEKAKALIEDMSSMYKDGMKEKALKMTEECFAEVKGADACEKAYSLYQCEKKKAQELAG